MAVGAGWATIIGVPIALISVGLAFLALESGGSSSNPKAEVASQRAPSPRLERIDLIARNGLAPHLPGLEMMVHNAGDGLALVSEARIKIIKASPIPLCFTQGDFPLSNVYGAQLPADAKPGDVIEAPLHEQLGPDEADRFKLALGISGGRPDGELPGFYLFEVAVSLVHDGSSRGLAMGRAVVSLPGLPFPPVYFLRKGDLASVDSTYNPQHAPIGEYWAEPLHCWRSNAEALTGTLASSAARSSELDAIGAEAVIPDVAAEG